MYGPQVGREKEGGRGKRVRVCPAHSALLSSLSLLFSFSLSRVQEVLWYAKNGPTTRLECAASMNSILLLYYANFLAR